MATEIFIQDGFILKHARKDKTYGLFSLNKFFKKLAKSLKIATVDDCCEADPTSLPVRYNSEESQLEYYNPETKSWNGIN